MDKVKEFLLKLVSSRRIWGGAILVVSALFGQEVGDSVNSVVAAVSAENVQAIMVAVGGALIAVSKLFAKKPA